MPLLQASSGLEATTRHKDGKTYLFLLNHHDTQAVATLSVAGYGLLSEKSYTQGEGLSLPPYGVEILELCQL